jgi:hypothetical protein
MRKVSKVYWNRTAGEINETKDNQDDRMGILCAGAVFWLLGRRYLFSLYGE